MAEIENLKRRIARLYTQLATYDKENMAAKYTAYGIWSIGYLEGKLAVLEEQLFDLKEAQN